MATLAVIRRDVPWKRFILSININKEVPKSQSISEHGDEAYVVYAVPDDRFINGSYDSEIIMGKSIIEKAFFESSWRHIS